MLLRSEERRVSRADFAASSKTGIRIPASMARIVTTINISMIVKPDWEEFRFMFQFMSLGSWVSATERLPLVASKYVIGE